MGLYCLPIILLTHENNNLNFELLRYSDRMTESGRGWG